MNIKKFSIAVIFLILAFIMALYIKGVFTQKKEYKFIFIPKASEDISYFWKNVGLGTLTACKEFGAEIKIYAPNSEREIELQNQYIRQAIEEKPDAILLSFISYDKQIELCDEISKAGIMLITVDSDIDSDNKRSFVGTDSFQAGKEAGIIIKNKVPEDGKIAIVSFVEGTSTSRDRENGFKSGISERQKKNIIGTYYCESTEEKARMITKQIITEYPDIAAIVGLNENAVTGICMGLKDMEYKNKVLVVGIDSTIMSIQGLESGLVDTLIVQNSFNMGYLAVDTAIKALNKEDVPNFVNTGIQIINKENMYTKENQKLLFVFADS